MSLCRDWTLVNRGPELVAVHPLECRCWSCEWCVEKRTAQLIALAKAGEPDRFLTLTVNPASPGGPAERLHGLKAAWNVILKRLRRRYPKSDIEFLAVVEATKAGEPHMHVLLRSPYLPHDLLSTWMAELINAPVVDIRKLDNAKVVAGYVAKYIAKAPAQFGTAKRYWTSRAWDLSRSTYEAGLSLFEGVWELEQRTWLAIADELHHSGWAGRSLHPDTLVFFRVSPGGGP